MVVHCRDNQFELNTLKISQDTKKVVRKPYVWDRPNARLYDYHYEIGGLYYQPMINYIINRGENGPHKVVDIPDRILSNYDRRAYALKEPDVDLEDFLTDSYKRRTKDINGKYVHVANEKVRHSKKSTDLGMVRGSACIRDKYLCQLQLHYTENKADTSEKVVDDLEVLKRAEDTSYGPGYKRVRATKPSREKRISQILEEKGREEDHKLRNMRTNNLVGLLNDVTSELVERAAETKLVTKEQREVEEKAASTYMVAMKEVKRLVDNKRREVEDVKINPLKLEFAYSGKPIDQLGICERAVMKSSIYKPRRLPDIDVGYDTVDRRLYCED